MQLRIIHRGSELLSLSTEVDTSVLQVKTVIGKAIAVPPKDQILTHRGVYLEDSRMLKDYKIEECGLLELCLPLSHQKVISVRVVISPHDDFSIPIGSSATVAELRAKIIKRASRHISDLSTASLVYSHWVLDDWRRLEEYEMEENACITVARALEPEKGTCEQAGDLSGRTSTVSSQHMINVHFLKGSGDPFTLTLDASKPLRSIGKSVEEMTGIPLEHQTYVLPRKQVDAERTPNSLNIGEGDSVYVGDSRSKELYAAEEWGGVNKDRMLVYFDLSGSRILMTIPRKSTVKEMGSLYQRHNHILGKKIDFYHEDVLLEAQRLLTDYGITDESVIHVHVSPL